MLRRFQRPAAFIRRHARAFGAVAAVCAIGLAVGSAATGDAANGRTVRTTGDEQFVPNAKIMATMKFSPGPISIASGETLTLTHADKTEDPHTLTIIDASEMPANIDDVFNCGAPGTVCDDAFAVFAGAPPDATFVNGPGTAAGIDGRLDSLFVLPGESVSETVTAPSGTDLYYICAIHAWMQGVIHVK